MGQGRPDPVCLVRNPSAFHGGRCRSALAQGPASLCPVCLCTYPSFRGACGLPLSGSWGPLPSGPVCVVLDLLRSVLCSGRSAHQAWKGVRGFCPPLQCCGLETSSSPCESPAPLAKFVRDARTGNVSPELQWASSLHVHVDVKFQNKQRALFLEEMCYSQK